MFYEISISILCGGSARRFKSTKALYELKGKPIIKIIYDRFKRFTDDIFLQGSKRRLIPGIKTYPDIIKDKGPLGGVYSSLINAKYQKIFVTACDLPFIDNRILKELVKYKKYDVVVPQWSNGYYEPLCALYSKNLILIIKAQIEKNILKTTKLFRCVAVKTVNIDRLIKEGKLREDCFKNINYPKDLMQSL